ncbi:hypothetical protein ACIBHY_30800 [Nonomuraea sp. NPDC050547]|uniref:hypothetical protein n=1 Tax=Nonomuraea sp. NPDC050547 TaxID=3364368 RepID=UPI003788D1AB
MVLAAGLIRVTSSPVVQIAADGIWETALVVPRRHPRADAVHEVARRARESVAVEVLWPGQAFVGVRWPVREAGEAVHALGRLGSGPGSVAADLAALLGAQARAETAFVEVGAVNAWRSTGSQVIWRRERPVTAPQAVHRLSARPDLLLCAHPVAAEFAATRPRPHWVGVTVSTPEGARHRLDADALAALLTAVLEI